MVIAEIHEGRGETDKALAQYEIAARQKDATPDSYVKMAMLANETDPDTALNILDRAEQRFPMDDLILAAVSYLSHANADRASAITLMNKFADRTDRPPTESFFLALGANYEQNGELDKAARVFEKGIKAYPDSHEMLNYLAYMWAEKGLHLDKGEKMTKKALQLQPESGAYLDTLGWIYYMQGKNAAALEYIRKALKQLPDDATILDHHGDILAKDGKIKDAIKEWQRSYELEPSNDALRKKLAGHNALPTEKSKE
jgi:tetratricopeptide (TPR) repeat protein